MVLIWLAVLLVRASGELDGPAVPALPAAGRRLFGRSTALLAALLVAGTLVTAAGPHAGDVNTPRLALGVPRLAQLHADLVVGYLGVLVGLGYLLRAVGAASALPRRHRVLVGAVLAQGALGAAQYALGVPEALVSLHVLGAALVTAAAAALWAARVVRPPVPGAEPTGSATKPGTEPTGSATKPGTEPSTEPGTRVAAGHCAPAGSRGPLRRSPT
jgi:cytochrome c oxidase assembly protein subunit 15